jgi:myo-inositol-1(or 4)-monophosphatase
MNTERIAQATEFAASAHDGSYRKGTQNPQIPYISHAIEAGIIAQSLTDDEDVIIAAILHDVVEDTNYELSDIEERFGSRVANFVSYESEEKMKDKPAKDTWKQRKEEFLEQLKTAPIEAKMICLSDKVSNMRLSSKTYQQKGDEMWLVFNQTDKKEQEWYYRSIAKELTELKDTKAYEEYIRLCNEVFGPEISRTPPKVIVQTVETDRKIFYHTYDNFNMDPFSLLSFLEEEQMKIGCFFRNMVIHNMYNEHICDRPIFEWESLELPIIILSDADKKVSGGTYTTRDLLKEVEKLAEKEGERCEIINRVLAILAEMVDVDKNEEKLRSLKEKLMGELNQIICRAEGEEKPCLKKLLELLKKWKTSNVILGEFSKDDYHITLYYETILRSHERYDDRGYNDRELYKAKLSNVLAHEYFHYMHYYITNYMDDKYQVYWRSQNTNGKEITESLAEFFSYLWSLEKSGREDTKTARDRYSSWRENLFTSWPYAKALLYMSDMDKDSSGLPQFKDNIKDYDVAVKKFMNIFQAMMQDKGVEEVFRMLIWK